jgi:lincosamide nucleotidyltransferase A/C/D/E
VQLSEVLAVTTALQEAGARFWVAGGWGVDALVGRVTRPHRDLDLAVAAEDLERAVERLAVLGYHPETDWLPVRLELAAPGGRWVDLHPVAFDGRGDGVQAGLDGSRARSCPAAPPPASRPSTVGTRRGPRTCTTSPCSPGWRLPGSANATP